MVFDSEDTPPHKNNQSRLMKRTCDLNSAYRAAVHQTNTCFMFIGQPAERGFFFCLVFVLVFSRGGGSRAPSLLQPVALKGVSEHAVVTSTITRSFLRAEGFSRN